MRRVHAARASLAAAIVAFFAAGGAGCQLKAASVPSNFITADPGTFVLKNVQRYDDANGSSTDSSIVVVTATYTNHEANPEQLAPEKFQLLDPTLMTTYVGLSGGGIDIPSMPATQLAPGKSADITVGFRVPSSMSGARLVYHP